MTRAADLQSAGQAGPAQTEDAASSIAAGGGTPPAPAPANTRAGGLAQRTPISKQDLLRLPQDRLEELHAGLKELERRQLYDRLASYAPYEKQKIFHAAGQGFGERAIIAANQVGKTMAAAAEAAMHATGRYPHWWEGRRWTRPTTGIAGSEDGKLQREGQVRLLMGAVGARGTGMIPEDAIVHAPAARGVPDSYDNVQVRHASGGISLIKFKTYDQGREAWQADTVDWVWMDEEPPMAVYSEALQRLVKLNGLMFCTFTPLKGVSLVVVRFTRAEDRLERFAITIGLEDVPEDIISADERARRLSATPAHERDARLRGLPMLGAGAVFPVEERLVRCDPFVIPRSWPRLGAMDFGWDHPFAAVEMAFDLDNDVDYVTRAYRVRHATPTIHVAAVQPWGRLRWAWPADGLQTQKDSGQPLAKQYQALGLDMIGEHAHFANGSVAVEAGLIGMLTRMETGRWKVFGSCDAWFEEFRSYHRKDGKVVKLMDDVISASRIGHMMKRYARVPPDQHERLITSGSTGLDDYDPF